MAGAIFLTICYPIFFLHHLILVNLGLLKLSLALLLEGDDDEGDEDVDEEEGEDDEVDDVEDGHLDAVERDGSLVFVCDGHRLLEHDRPTLEKILTMKKLTTIWWKSPLWFGRRIV